MKVYILDRYWDNDEGYPEDFSHHNYVEKIFRTKEAGVKYLKEMSVTDILGSECPGKDGWYIDEAGELNTNSETGDVMRDFYAKNQMFDTYWEGANIVYTLHEMEVEE